MADTNNIDNGRLKITTTTTDGTRPVRNARIDISYTGEPDRIIESLRTDESGSTETIELPAPPLEYSMAPSDHQPYSEYNLKITADNYDDEIVTGVQILPNVTGFQNINLILSPENPNVYNPIVIGGHTLWEYYPPKIAEAEVKPVNETGEIVLSKVVVPETIVVHDGVPTDSTATDYYVPYSDYIKNVASCEIYSTWPMETIKANVLAIMSFTLNRVYTEWYRNKGYDFTITSSTAFDHKWMNGKTTYDTISQAVDEVFASFLARPNVKQPILTQYCDGKRVTCPNWMSQWGSKTLGDDGLSAIDIIRYYYGNDMYINTAEVISGIPSSFPGTLTIGSSGDKVLQLQEQLNRIALNYPAIPQISADGIYGERTAEAVRTFQKIFNLPQTGVTDYATWYKISQIYVAVSKIAELT